MQCIEQELAKEKRKARLLVKGSPAVADAFLRLRRAEDQERLVSQRIADQRSERKRDAAKALKDRDAAVAELRETRRKIQEMESVGACRHAIKTFTPEALGEGNANAGGAKARKSRFEGSQQVRRMTGHGSRKRGTKRWSRSMGLIGHRFLRKGCRACWMTSAATHSPRSCIQRHVAYSMTLRRCMCRGADRSRGLPQSRTPAVAGSRIRGKIATSLTSEAQCRCVGGSWNVW